MYNNICIIRLPEEEEERHTHTHTHTQGGWWGEMEDLFEEIMTGNFPNLAKETDTQVQEA